MLILWGENLTLRNHLVGIPPPATNSATSMDTGLVHQ